MDFDRDILKPGDAMLYYGDALPNAQDARQHAGFVDWAIGVKTGGLVAHIELYDVGGSSVASRNGIGVNRYATRLNGLIAVRRTKPAFDWLQGEGWFNSSARGEKYDFKGLLCFWLAVRQGSQDRMFCSEFALRRYRASSFQPFNPDQDADRTSPFDFWKCGNMDTIWKKPSFNV